MKRIFFGDFMLKIAGKTSKILLTRVMLVVIDLRAGYF